MTNLLSAKYIVTESFSEQKDILETWRWKIGMQTEIVYLTRNGDAILKTDLAEYLFLDTANGSLEKIANSSNEWDMFTGNEAALKDLLLVNAVDAFVAQFGDCPGNHCLGFKIPAVAGGSFAPENRYFLSITEHFSFTGYFHEQIVNLPDGSQIQFQVTDK
jgi:hypothetical protein